MMSAITFFRCTCLFICHFGEYVSRDCMWQQINTLTYKCISHQGLLHPLQSSTPVLLIQIGQCTGVCFCCIYEIETRGSGMRTLVIIPLVVQLTVVQSFVEFELNRSCKYYVLLFPLQHRTQACSLFRGTHRMS